MLAGQLEIQLMADVARIRTDMDQARRTVEDNTTRMAKAADMAKTALGAIAGVLSVAAFGGMIKGSLDTIDSLTDLSTRTRVTVEDLAGLSYGAKLSGADLEKAAASITKLATNMGTDADKFSKLGVTAKEPIEAFKQFATVFKNIEDPQQRAALGAAVLGKSWQDAAVLLDEGGEGIAELVKRGQQLSGITTQSSADAAQFNDMLDEFGAIAAGAGARVATGLLPMLNLLAGDLLKTAEGAEDAGNSFSPLMETFRALVILGGNVAFVFKTIGNDIGGIAASVASLVALDFKALKNIDTMMKEDATSGRASFDAWEKRWLEVGKTAKKVEAEAHQSSEAERKAAAEKTAAFLKDAEIKAAAEKKVTEAAAQAKRIAAEAQRERDAAAKKAAQESAAAIKQADDFIEALKVESRQVGLGSDQLKMMAAARAAAVAPTAELRTKIMEEALALDIATKAAKAKADADQVVAQARANSESEVAAINSETEALLTKIRTHGMLPEAITLAQIAELEAAKQSAVLTDEGIADIQRRIDALKGLADAQLGAGALGDAPGLTQAKELLEVMAEIDEATKSAASGMAASFGKVGSAIGGLTTALSGYGRAQAAIAAQLAAVKDDKRNSPETVLKAEIAAAKQSAQARVKSYGDMATAAKGFFKVNSTGYKVMEGAEKAFRATEMAMAIEAMLTKSGLLRAFTGLFVTSRAAESAADDAATGKSIINSGLRAAADGVAAFAKTLASLPFPYNVAAGAAVIALLAGVGVAMSGGGGGGGGGMSAAEVQKKQGTGGVFGDKDARSASIQRSLEMLEANSGNLIPINQGMLTALRSIEASMKGLTNLIVRAPGVVDGSNMGIQTGVKQNGQAIVNSQLLGSSINPLASVMQKVASFIFGKVTTTIVDSGIQFGGRVNDLQAGAGYEQYASVDTKKKGLFGSSTNNTMNTQALDPALASQFSQIFTDAETVLGSAAESLGVRVEHVTATLDALTIDKTKLSFKGLSGDALTEALNAAISKTMDDMAEAVFPDLNGFREVGEGYAETVIRLASNSAILDSALSSIGMTFGATGVSSLAARQYLIDLAGGIDALSEQASGFANNYLTEAERLAPVQRQVTEQMAALGMAGVTTRDQFKEVVLGLDLNTAKGAETYTGLMALQEAFALVTPGAKDMAAVFEERAGLQEEYDATTMTSAQLLAKQRDALDESNRALFDSVVAAQAAKDANEATAASMRSYAEQIATLEQASMTLEQRRAAEIAGLDATVAPLARQLHAMQDQATAAKEAAAVLDSAAVSARAIVTERAGLEREMMQLQGDTAGLRKLELDALNPANKALKEAIFAIQDKNAADALAAKSAADALKLAQDAAKEQQDIADDARRAAEQIQSAYRAITESIFDEVARVRGMLNENTPASIADAQAAFSIKTAQARAGDQEAAKLLPQLSKSLLDLSEANALTAMDRDRVRAQTMGSLIDTGNILSRMFGLEPSVFAAGAAASTPAPAVPGQPYVQNVAVQGGDTRGLEVVVERLTAQVAAQQTVLNRIASNTQRSADTQDRLSDGGVAVRTKEVPA
ncbi:hypothetical protein CR152_31945 [Massilia violaceinigra]|uniref:Bacteriophage tail tape measure N-terminal domain-containing protein n=1 Tax=Massilia violaceinigra TaxID=2045208 RepID=A0A2D2DUH0_9BURK|nr:hypothetical protein [Massilia violaceinigra]ATQ78618.1 hypothetical protein CR152_31945 [Massilia violaceinigra]